MLRRTHMLRSKTTYIEFERPHPRGDTARSRHKLVKRGLKILNYLKLPEKVLLMARGRRPLYNHDTDQTILYNLPEPDYSKQHVLRNAQAPDLTPVGYKSFQKEMKNTRLVGKGLIPIDQEGYLASEDLALNLYTDLSITTVEMRPLLFPKKRVLKGHYISLVNHWTTWKGFYHWFTDVLPRLRSLEERHKIIIRKPAAPYEIDSLKILGLLERCVFIEEDYLELEHFTYTSPSSYSGAYDPEAIDFVRNSFLEKVDIPSKTRKIYVTRKGERRCPLNEEQVISYFEALGWEIIDCKTMSLKKQIEVFHQASHIAASHGGALVNLLWAQSTCKVYEFFPSNRIVATNENIALRIGADYHAYIFPSDKKGVQIDIAKLKTIFESPQLAL